MPEYEGIVATLKEGGKAEVIIQPGNSGIPGVSKEVNSKVCHCTTDGSTITIGVENRAGAEVGDWVLISREKDALIRNAGALLGIPAIGGVLGVVAALILTVGFSAGTGAWIISPVCGGLVGIVSGVMVFRRISACSQPFISRIIKTRLEMAGMPADEQCPIRRTDGTCDTCSGSFF